MGILTKLKEGAKQKFAEQKQLSLQRKSANKIISKRARAEAYKEREKQEIRLAKEREKLRADTILKREKLRLKSSGSGLMSIAQNYTQNAQSQSFSMFGSTKQPPIKKKKVIKRFDVVGW